MNALLLVAALATRIVASDGMGGSVRDAESKPLAGVYLEARASKQGAMAAADFEGEPAKSMRTDADGRWAFPDLGAGTWIVTAVSSTEPRTDAELQELARPRDGGELPAGVAITRVIRHFGERAGRMMHKLDLGMATGERAATPLRGRLTGAFTPDTIAYEVAVDVIDPRQVASGEGSFVFEVTEDTPNTRFTTVPDSEGRFDFGPLRVGKSVALFVEAQPRDPDLAELSTTTHRSFTRWDEGVEVDLRQQRTITLRAVAREGASADGPLPGAIDFTVWDEHGGEISWSLEEEATHQALLDGTYFARASMGELASLLTAFTVSATSPLEVPLVLQHCPPFKVKLVDQHGQPMKTQFMKLGPESAAGFPSPFRVMVVCEDGTAELEGLLPGIYDVEFGGRRKPKFNQKLELKPGDTPIVVTVPDTP